jgi:long-chain fatty acid transport protein
MSRKKTLALLAAMLLVLAPAARSAGFLIYEHGAAAMAMAGAFTSLAKDPSALWHNPAGMAWLEGTQIMAGATFIFPKGSVAFNSYPGTPSYNQVHQIFTPPNFYLTHKFSDKLAAGLGVCAPYGLGIEWPDPDTFLWRYLGTMADMKTFVVNPAVAYKFSDHFSVGIGVSFIFSSFAQSVTQVINMGKPAEVPTDMDANGTAFGFNAGILYKDDNFSLGVNYRSRFRLKYQGTVALDVPGYPEPLPGTVDVALEFPDIATMGLSFNLTEKLVWAVDLHYLFWTVYDSYTAHVVVPDLEMTEDIVSEPKWNNSFTARTGLEYLASDKLSLRLGFIYDRTPQPAASMDGTLPDADRVAFTGGFGYKIGKLVVDVAYHFESFRKRTSERPDLNDQLQGTFKTQAHLIGINLGYRF